ncbi:hypothetical protein EV401DRAFT_1799853, partial [Pisolithus croceorrhizus]
RVILSGIQPTDIPYLGNYPGALSNSVKVQKTTEPADTLLFSIVGWLALTLPQDPPALRSGRDDMLATLLAIGLDPERSIVFHQDRNLHRVELCWVLNCSTPVDNPRRMTTWKSLLAIPRNAGSEDEVDESLLNSGLFTYLVLQAAGVLVKRSELSTSYPRPADSRDSGATHVPVGEDQQQHTEL